MGLDLIPVQWAARGYDGEEEPLHVDADHMVESVRGKTFDSLADRLLGVGFYSDINPETVKWMLAQLQRDYDDLERLIDFLESVAKCNLGIKSSS